MLFYMLYSVFIEKIQSKIFSLFVSQFTFSQATQKTPCLNGEYDIPANIRGGRMALSRGKLPISQKKTVISKLENWGLPAFQPYLQTQLSLLHCPPQAQDVQRQVISALYTSSLLNSVGYNSLGTLLQLWISCQVSGKIICIGIWGVRC